MSNHSHLDPGDILWELNNQKAISLIPAIVYVGILMILGTFGNCVVLYFYGYKTKPTPSTGFIVALAVFDVISCLVGMPMEIADLRFHYNFESVIACKILRVVTHFASMGSGLTLVIIAIDRYRRICRPFRRQLNRKHVKVACIIITIIAAILSWPAALFNTPVEVDIENDYNVVVKGRDCTTSKEDHLKVYIFVFNVVYLVLFVLITSILSVLYTFVGRQLYRHKKFRFYVAKKRAKATRIKVSQAPSTIPEENLSPQNTDTPSNEVFDDPPDACEPVVDMKEFITQGMPEVESVGPESNDVAITKTITTVTDGMGLSHKSKSLKSVTICDPSYNQIFSIEQEKSAKANDDSIITKEQANNTPESAEGDKLEDDKTSQRNETFGQDQEDEYDLEGLSLQKPRPISASSFATFSSRPSSATISNLGEHDEDMTYAGEMDEEDFDFRDLMIHQYEEIHSSSYSRSSGDILENTDDLIDESGIQIQRHPVDLRLEKEKTYVSIPDETIDRSEDGYAILDSERPLSQASGESKASKSSRLRRVKRNTITPVSSVDSSVISSTATDITLTSSVASRASTVKRFKRLFKHSWKGGRMDTDTDNIKDLRTKMLDINTIKYTMIMISVTVVFVISFLPYLSLIIWRYYWSDHESKVMSDTELVLFQIGIRSFFLQSSFNPIIYGGFNSKFRAFFYSTFCRCCIVKRKIKKKSTKPRDHSDSTSAS